MSKFTPRSRWPGVQGAMYPAMPRGALEERSAKAEEGWKLPTSGEYLRRKQAERFLGRSEWYLRLQEQILPELRAVAMRDFSRRWPKEEEDGPVFELQQIEGMLGTMNALIQTPPKAVRHPPPSTRQPCTLHPPTSTLHTCLQMFI